MRNKKEYLALAVSILLIRFLLLGIGLSEPWAQELKTSVQIVDNGVKVGVSVLVDLIALLGLFVTKGRAFALVAPLFVIGLLLGLTKEAIFYVGHNIEMATVVASFLLAYQIWFVVVLLWLRQPMALFLLPRLAWSALEVLGMVEQLDVLRREKAGKSTEPLSAFSPLIK